MVSPSSPLRAMEECSNKLQLCCEPLNLQFQDLRYSIRCKGGKTKEVLHDVCGQLSSGRLTAILGPSGAGKTTLLNALAGFKTKGLTGTLLVNGVKRNYQEFRSQACYITQDVSMLGQMTACETLNVAAELKLASSSEEKSFVVAEILDLLALTKCKNTYVRNLSGGEKKRLSIGLELITNPPIMFVDEPTSGVDSVSSTQIMCHLKGLAEAGRTVVCVIHQPSSKLCELIDDVILLAEGQILYSGPTNQILPVFKEAGFTCPDHYNPADFMLEVACRERGSDLSRLLNRFQYRPPESLENHDDVRIDSEDNAQFTLNMKKTSFVIENCDENIIGNKYKSKKNMYAVRQSTQFLILLKRNMVCTYRDVYMAQLRVSSHLLVGLLLGIMFFGIGNDAAKIESNAACIFFFGMFLFFVNGWVASIAFPTESSVFIREHLNNWYSVPTYFFAMCVANVPMQLVCPFAFLLPGYWLTGQPVDIERFSMTLLLCTLGVMLGQTLGMAIGANFQPSMGTFLLPVSTLPMLLFSGFFQRLPDIPFYFRWLGQMSYFRNLNEGLITTTYGFHRAPLDCSEPFCFFKMGSKFVKHLGMAEENLWYDILGLVVWNLFMYVLLLLAIMWRIRVAK